MFRRWMGIGLIGSGLLVPASIGAFNVSLATTGAPQSPTTETGAPSGNDQQNPVLRQRPAPKPGRTGATRKIIRLDVTVRDAAGLPVTGMQPWDFKLLDNGQPRKIDYFRAFGARALKPDPPVEVILLVDEMNLPLQQVAFVKSELKRYFLTDDGKLAQPVVIMLVSDRGLRVQPHAVTDGKALVKMVNGIKGQVSTINAAMGAYGDIERFQRSVHQMEDIAENEARFPGRKLLLWIGPGWPILNRPHSTVTDRDQKLYFDAIVELSTRLREANMVVNSLAPAETTAGSDALHTFVYRDFLKGVTTPNQAYAANLALKVLAVQTGGLVLGPSNDLVEQIEQCIDDANDFYQIVFEPPPAAHRDEYHELKIIADQPGVTVRTRTGYYDASRSYGGKDSGTVSVKLAKVRMGLRVRAAAKAHLCVKG